MRRPYGGAEWHGTLGAQVVPHMGSDGGPPMSATLTVPITPDLEALIRERIESGKYHDERAVVWEALRVLDEQERLQRLRDALAIGLEQLERGEEVEYT